METIYKSRVCFKNIDYDLSPVNVGDLIELIYDIDKLYIYDLYGERIKLRNEKIFGIYLGSATLVKEPYGKPIYIKILYKNIYCFVQYKINLKLGCLLFIKKANE